MVVVLESVESMRRAARVDVARTVPIAIGAGYQDKHVIPAETDSD